MSQSGKPAKPDPTINTEHKFDVSKWIASKARPKVWNIDSKWSSICQMLVIAVLHDDPRQKRDSPTGPA